MSIKMPHGWKKIMLNMWSFDVGGIPLGWLMKLDFKS
jgi:hypothetical protein